MEHVMERHYDFDLTYITERIISVFFLPVVLEQWFPVNNHMLKCDLLQ